MPSLTIIVSVYHYHLRHDTTLGIRSSHQGHATTQLGSPIQGQTFYIHTHTHIYILVHTHVYKLSNKIYHPRRATQKGNMSITQHAMHLNVSYISTHNIYNKIPSFYTSNNPYTCIKALINKHHHLIIVSLEGASLAWETSLMTFYDKCTMLSEVIMYP